MTQKKGQWVSTYHPKNSVLSFFLDGMKPKPTPGQGYGFIVIFFSHTLTPNGQFFKNFPPPYLPLPPLFPFPLFFPSPFLFLIIIIFGWFLHFIFSFFGFASYFFGFSFYFLFSIFFFEIFMIF